MLPEAGDPPEFQTPEGPRVTIAGTSYDWFRSSGYLGLHHHPEVLGAAVEATLRYGLKLRDKRSVGCHSCLLELERQARRFFDAEAVACFSSGYAAGAGLLAGLDDRFDIVLLDREAHWSLGDAAAACGRPIVRFAHRDVDDLRRRLRRLQPGQRPLVLTDGLFPISGALAPLPDYWAALEPYDGALLGVDDAHAAGVLGVNGRGTLEHFVLEGPRRHGCATLSKAFGTHGGLVAGGRALVARIEAHSRVRRASALPPPGIVAASARALALVMEQPEIRRQLAANVACVRRGLHALGLAVDPDSPAPVICLDRRNRLDFAAVERTFFAERRIAVLHIPEGYPSTPAGGALVFSVFADHTESQLDRLLDAFRQVV